MNVKITMYLYKKEVSQSDYTTCANQNLPAFWKVFAKSSDHKSKSYFYLPAPPAQFGSAADTDTDKVPLTQTLPDSASPFIQKFTKVVILLSWTY